MGAIVLFAVTLYIPLNLVVILARAWNFSKLLYARHQKERSHAKEAASKLSNGKRRLACVGVEAESREDSSASPQPPVQEQVINEVSSILEAEVE